MDARKRWRLSWGDVTTSSIKLVVLFSVLPLFHAQNKELSYTIYEEGPIPALVGNIARDSNVSQLLGSDVFSTLRLVLLVSCVLQPFLTVCLLPGLEIHGLDTQS